jgi:hypothetical protein
MLCSLREIRPVNIIPRSRPVDDGPHDRFWGGEGGASIGLLGSALLGKCDNLWTACFGMSGSVVKASE